ncbi:MAG: 30S ribosomal protein S9 [Candidatus Liptonbacteria bacterium]|nr:30S ribosomal protein S9 [Candidatus Liptonbacteria bacterium]
MPTPKTKKDSTTASATGGRYHSAVGRRKTAVARVRLIAGSGVVQVNGRTLDGYFALPHLRRVALAPLKEMQMEKQYDLSVRVLGGGFSAQAEAIRLGLARVLILITPEAKKRLRVSGFLTRDPRVVERKKYGLKKARRAPQWSKR